MGNQIKYYPPFYFIILLVFQILIHFLYPWRYFLVFPYRLIGLAFILFGVLLIYFPHKQFISKGITLSPDGQLSVLLKDGMFRYSRNPMYLGMTVFLFGFAVLLGSMFPLLAPVAFVIIIHYKFILFEEQKMIKEFGNEYEEYLNSVHRWI